MIEADALILHFNALQEAVQPEGDTRFAGLAAKVEAVCRALPVPVIAKEVGWGFSQPDIACWRTPAWPPSMWPAQGALPGLRWRCTGQPTQRQKRLAAAFIDWGIPTAEAISNVRTCRTRDENLCFRRAALGRRYCQVHRPGRLLGGMAGPFLKAAVLSVDETVQTINEIAHEIQVCMFAAGAGDLQALRQTALIET